VIEVREAAVLGGRNDPAGREGEHMDESDRAKGTSLYPMHSAIRRPELEMG